MLRNRLLLNFLIILVLGTIVCGCGNKKIPVTAPSTASTSETVSQPEQREPEKEVVLGMQSSPSLDFEIPQMYPGIMVNRIGYETGRDKEALIIADTIPAEFKVIDRESQKTVYTGKVKPTDYRVGECYTAVADFSDLDIPGTYYIETEILGCSFDFSISGTIYADLLSNTFTKLHSLRCEDLSPVSYESNPNVFGSMSGGWYTNAEGERDVVEGCLGILDLIIAYEYHPKSFSDKMGVESGGNKIPDILDEAAYEAGWLMKMQNPETGGVYNGISLRQIAGGSEKQLMIVGESSKATAYFCAALAKFSLIYNKYDSAFASKCLKAAAGAWNCLQANKNLVTDAQMYRAAVEMYNATGKTEYEEVIDKYLQANADAPLVLRGLVDAAISYMASSRDINVKYCRQLMAAFLDRTQTKIFSAKKIPYGIESAEMTVGDLLRNTNEMVIVDYINTSRQYEKNELEYLHYLCGRNVTSTVYADELTNPDDCAKLLVLLGRLVD